MAFTLGVRRARVLQAVRLLRHYRKWVRFAEPDYLMQASGVKQNVPNDPFFPLQWGSLNTGQIVNGATGTAGADDRAAAAWAFNTGSRSIVIGEADSGVDYTHPDLAANIWSNPGGVGGCPAGTHGYNFVAGTCDPMDDDNYYGGHGTHVAGIMGAVGNNGAGVAGMNWSTTILPVKWLDSNSYGSTDQLISALDWLVKDREAGVNVRVVNDSATFVGTASSQALSDEIDLLGANNILFVTAAGNTGQDNDNPQYKRYPCGYDRPTEICVTATDQHDALPSYANWGVATVDLGAPGDNIYSTLRNGAYGYISGGSMAAAQVSGAAALILSAGNLSTAALKADILGSVDPLASLSGLVRTGGRLDVCKAIPACANPASSPGTFGSTVVGGLSDRFLAGRKRVNAYSLPVAGSVSKLSLYLSPTGTSGQQNIEGVIYADSGGAPGALLGTTRQLAFSSTQAAGWYDLSFPSALSLPAGKYWIGVITGGSSDVAGFRYTSVSGSRDYDANSYTAGPSDPFGAFSTDGEQMSLYATYTSGSPPSATFGTTTVGASYDAFAADRKRVNAYSLPVTGSVSKLSVYLYPWGPSGQQEIEGVVYADAGGAPGALLGATGQLAFSSTQAAGWYDLKFSSALSLPAGKYWIGVITGASSDVAGFRYVSVSGSRDYDANSYSAGPSDPFGSFSTDGEQMSLYATYGPS